NLCKQNWSITRVSSVLVKRNNDILLLYEIVNGLPAQPSCCLLFFLNQKLFQTDPNEHFKKELEVTLLAMIT
ncbi:hypothetical protein H5410_012635, partial [Solanum commersonii]